MIPPVCVCSRGRDGHLSDLFSLCVTQTASVLAICDLIRDLVYDKYLLSSSFYPEGHLCSPRSPCPVGMMSVSPPPLGAEA